MGLIKRRDISTLFRARDTQFGDINIYVSDHLSEGDYIIPVSGRASDAMNSVMTEKLEQHISKHDPRLMALYRRNATVIDKIEVRFLGKEEMGGLLEYVDLFTSAITKKLNKMSASEIEKITEELQEMYDEYMTENTSSHVCKIWVWIPCHKILSKYCREITLFKRVTLVFT